MGERIIRRMANSELSATSSRTEHRPHPKPPKSRRPQTARLAKDSNTAAFPDHVPLAHLAASDSEVQEVSATHWWQPASLNSGNRDWTTPQNPLLPGGRKLVDPSWQDQLWDAKVAMCDKPPSKTPRISRTPRLRSRAPPSIGRKSGAATARQARPASAVVSHSKYDCERRPRCRNWSMPQPPAIADAVDGDTPGLISMRDPDFMPTKLHQRQKADSNEAARYEGKVVKPSIPKCQAPGPRRPATSRGNWAIRQGLAGEIGAHGGMYMG